MVHYTSLMRSIRPVARVWMAAAIVAAAGSALTGQKAGDAFRTRDGQPDLQGTWRFATITPIERPAEFADKSFLTVEEAKAYQARRLAALDLDNPVGARAGLNGPSVNEFWSERGELALVAGRFPTSLVVDPVDGRIPPFTSARQARTALRGDVRRRGEGAEAFTAS